MSTENISKEKPLPRVSPACDILEKADGFHIFLDMPGVDKECLAIDLHKNEVTVSGKSCYPAEPLEDKKRKFTHVEFGGAEFRRTFTLSDNVDREKITAQLKNGVLDLYLPKSEHTKPRRIDISQA